MSNIIKHKILKELHKVYYNNPHLPDDKLSGFIGRSLSFDHLKQRLKISDLKLNQNLEYLVLNDEVFKLHKHSENQHTNYKLNENGRKSFYAKSYYSKVWFMNKTFIISIISILISLLAIGLNYYKDNSSAKKSIELENRIINIEKKLNNPKKTSANVAFLQVAKKLSAKILSIN